MTEYYPLIVVGAGHAGCEAALAASRLGIKTLLLTMNLSTVALMPCNPSIGGPGKGHLVREIGALGGEMASCIDETLIQIKWLNTSRGSAVRAKRAQADKELYRKRMLQTLFSTFNLIIRQGQVIKIETVGNEIRGVEMETGIKFQCDKLVLATGTYLESRIIIGPNSRSGGPHNQRAATGLSTSLKDLGIDLRRLQTATPPRIAKQTVEIGKMRVLDGDPRTGGFLWENRVRIYDNQIPCYLTFTGEKTIDAVRRNLKDSPLVLANITNVGPKHCPSIDRKVLKFPNQFQHQIFVEPEGRDSFEMYLQGLTTSMPPAAQREIISTVPGLESARILRYGYAIEYDALIPGSIKKTMASRIVSGLYTAGQINGTSGYEEAAAQGLIAGINAAASILGKPEYSPSRTQGYIGVLVDDLATWDHPEPYRITPANAEFRLHLRDDSAEERLVDDGFTIGLVSRNRREKIGEWSIRIAREIERLQYVSVTPREALLAKLLEAGTGGLKKTVTAAEILQRPNVRYSDLGDLLGEGFLPRLTLPDEIEKMETQIKYSGYMGRDTDRLKELKLLESIKLPIYLPDDKSGVISPETRKLLESARFDDLGQLVRKNCVSKGELVILLSILKSLSKEMDRA